MLDGYRPHTVVRTYIPDSQAKWRATDPIQDLEAAGAGLKHCSF